MRDGTIIYTDISRTEGAKRYLAMIRKYPLFLKVYKIFLSKLRCCQATGEEELRPT